MDLPFTFLLNAGSGKQDIETIQAILQRLIPPHRQGCFYVVRPGDDFRHTLNEAVDDCRHSGGVFVAAGGDGTVNAAINHILPLGLTLGVIPLGTFNYFARMHGIPVDPEAAVLALLEAKPLPLPVCLINGEPFIVNVSLGLHAKIIAERERYTKITGRNRLVALLSGIVTLLKEQYTLRAQLILDNKKLQRKATTVMISHNRLQLETLKLADTQAELEGCFAVVVIHPLSRRELLSLLWRRLLGQMDGTDEFERFWARDLEIRLLRPYVRVVIDGELRHFRTPLRIRMQPDAIRCLVPRQQAE